MQAQRGAARAGRGLRAGRGRGEAWRAWPWHGRDGGGGVAVAGGVAWWAWRCGGGVAGAWWGGAGRLQVRDVAGAWRGSPQEEALLGAVAVAKDGGSLLGCRQKPRLLVPGLLRIWPLDSQAQPCNQQAVLPGQRRSDCPGSIHSDHELSQGRPSEAIPWVCPQPPHTDSRP